MLIDEESEHNEVDQGIENIKDFEQNTLPVLEKDFVLQKNLSPQIKGNNIPDDKGFVDQLELETNLQNCENLHKQNSMINEEDFLTLELVLDNGKEKNGSIIVNSNEVISSNEHLEKEAESDKRIDIEQNLQTVFTQLRNQFESTKMIEPILQEKTNILETVSDQRQTNKPSLINKSAFEENNEKTENTLNDDRIVEENILEENIIDSPKGIDAPFIEERENVITQMETFFEVSVSKTIMDMNLSDKIIPEITLEPSSLFQTINEEIKQEELKEEKEESLRQDTGSIKSPQEREKTSHRSPYQTKPFKILKSSRKKSIEGESEEREPYLSKLEKKEARKDFEKKRIMERENKKRMILSNKFTPENANSSNEEEESAEENCERIEERSSDDELEKLFERKIKKKAKIKKKEDSDEILEIEITGPGSKSTSSEPEHKISDDFMFKKGTTTTREHEKFETIPYTEEFPRRSLREKREPPKSFDKKLYRFLKG